MNLLQSHKLNLSSRGDRDARKKTKHKGTPKISPKYFPNFFLRNE